MPPLMPAAKLRPRFAEHDDQAAGHVFAAVIAHAFHHRRRAGIAHREPLAGHAVEKSFAAGGAIEHHVADQDVFFRQNVEARGG